MQLAEEQEPVCMAPKYGGDPATTSLLYESDLVHTKLNTDIILHGHAYAPGGRPTTATAARLKVANVDKSLWVVGDRTWKSSFLRLAISDPAPFTMMPLTYERAFGGTDQLSENPKHRGWEPRNPVGVGFAARAEHLVDMPVPNLEDPASPVHHWRDRPRPMAFGPIPGHWAPRIQYAGTYDEKWQKERLPLLPLDFDDRFHQCAPEDQQADGFLKGGETVELYNLTSSGYLSFQLPRVILAFETHFGSGSETHRANLHTVILEPDHPRVMMVWHTMLPCHHKAIKLERTTIRQKEILRLAGR